MSLKQSDCATFMCACVSQEITQKLQKNEMKKNKNAHHTIHITHFTMMMATMDPKKHTVVHLDAEAMTRGEAIHNRNIDETFNDEMVVAPGWRRAHGESPEWMLMTGFGAVWRSKEWCLIPWKI